MSSLRVGVIGCGRISRMHLGGYGRVDDVTVVAGADPVQPVLQDFRREAGISALYEDYREMLEAEQLDVVSICTWPPLHHRMVLDAVAAGVRIIFCEKPIAVDLEQAEEMVSVCTEAGVLLIVNHYRRFAPVHRAAKQRLDSGAIGALERLQVRSIGDLLTDGTHAVDLLRFYNDDAAVATVFGQVDISQVVERYGHWTENGVLTSIAFTNGVPAGIELVSGASSTDMPYLRVVITGSEGSIDVRGDGDPRFVLRRDGHEPEKVVIDNTSVGHVAFAAEVEAALAVLAEGGEHPLSGASARDDLEVLTAVFVSARDHTVVRLPVSASTFPLVEMVDPDVVVPEVEVQRRTARLGA